MILGGYGGYGPMHYILKFNPALNEWEQTGIMRFGRQYHSLAVLPLEEVKPYCT